MLRFSYNYLTAIAGALSKILNIAIFTIKITKGGSDWAMPVTSKYGHACTNTFITKLRRVEFWSTCLLRSKLPCKDEKCLECSLNLISEYLVPYPSISRFLVEMYRLSLNSTPCLWSILSRKGIRVVDKKMLGLTLWKLNDLLFSVSITYNGSRT